MSDILQAIRERDIDAIQEFLDECEGKHVEQKQSTLPLNRQVERVEFEPFGDWIYYKDGHREWRSNGDTF